jgi:hypothetical protein
MVKMGSPKKANGTFDHENALTGDDLIDYKIGRFQSGYSLRDALELIDELRFQSQKEKHELSHLYEAKIETMGNAGRNGGDYYTPRPLTRAMIEVTKPKLGERIYDGPSDRTSWRADHQPAQDAANPHLLRQGKEKPHLRHRHTIHRRICRLDVTKYGIDDFGRGHIPTAIQTRKIPCGQIPDFGAGHRSSFIRMRYSVLPTTASCPCPRTTECSMESRPSALCDKPPVR